MIHLSTHYRLYFFSRADNITRVDDLECADDTEAKAIAQSYAGRQRMELCHGDRCIKWFDISRRK